jgi:hypothetical protein
VLLLLLLLLLAVATEYGKVTDGLRTAVCGPLSQHVADTLQANGVTCAVVDDWDQFHQLMLVKLLWSCIFWLLSAGLGGATVSACAFVFWGKGGVGWRTKGGGGLQASCCGPASSGCCLLELGVQRCEGVGVGVWGLGGVGVEGEVRGGGGQKQKLL